MAKRIYHFFRHFYFILLIERCAIAALGFFLFLLKITPELRLHLKKLKTSIAIFYWATITDHYSFCYLQSCIRHFLFKNALIIAFLCALLNLIPM